MICCELTNLVKQLVACESIIHHFKPIKVVVQIPVMGIKPCKHLIFKVYQDWILLPPFRPHPSSQDLSLCICQGRQGCVQRQGQGRRHQCCRCGHDEPRAWSQFRTLQYQKCGNKSQHPVGRSLRSCPCTCSSAPP